MTYTQNLLDFVAEINRGIYGPEAADLSPIYLPVLTWDSEYFGEPVTEYDPEDPEAHRAASDWDYWDENCVFINIGCSNMSVNIVDGTFRAWHQTSDNDPIRAMGRGLEEGDWYTVFEDKDEGEQSFHDCVALPGEGQDAQVSSLYAALVLWESGELRINYLSRREEDHASGLCAPDLESLQALSDFLDTCFKKCIEAGCPGAEMSQERLDRHG